MRTISINTVLLALGFAMLVTLSILRSAHSGVNASYFSTYDIGRNGYRALYSVLRREGLRMRRFEQPIGLLDPRIRTLVLSSNALEVASNAGAADLSAADATRLRTFVRRGGRLVLLGRNAYPALRIALHVPLAAHAAAAMNLASETSKVGVFAPIAHVASNAGVAQVQARESALFPLAAAPEAVPLLGNRKGILAFEVRSGKGSVVVIAAPDAWSNAQLAQRDNARFAYTVLARNGAIAFDERVHGYAVDTSFWAALPRPVHIAIFIVIALVLLWLIDANFFTPPARIRAPLDERDTRAYLDAVAVLLRRARAGAAVIAHFADDIERRAHHRQPTQPSALAQLQQLRGVRRPKDADVLRAAQLHVSLRKDLT